MTKGSTTRGVLTGVVGLLGVTAMLSVAPTALAGQQQSAENHRIAAACQEGVATPTRPGPGTDPIETTAQRSLGCGNANVEVLIYENIMTWPDEQEAHAASHFAVGGITARGNGADKEHGSLHYAILKVNGQEIHRSEGVQ